MPAADSTINVWHCARDDATLTCTISRRPSCPYCGRTMDRDRLADTAAIAILTSTPEPTIRAWAQTGKLIRRGTDNSRRAMYSIREAIQLAQTDRQLDNRPDQQQH